MEVATLRITDSGRRALVKRRAPLDANLRGRIALSLTRIATASGVAVCVWSYVVQRDGYWADIAVVLGLMIVASVAAIIWARAIREQATLKNDNRK